MKDKQVQKRASHLKCQYENSHQRTMFGYPDIPCKPNFVQISSFSLSLCGARKEAIDLENGCHLHPAVQIRMRYTSTYSQKHYTSLSFSMCISLSLTLFFFLANFLPFSLFLSNSLPFSLFFLSLSFFLTLFPFSLPLSLSISLSKNHFH